LTEKIPLLYFFIGRKYRKNMNFWPRQAKFSHRIWIGKSDVSGWGGPVVWPRRFKRMFFQRLTA